MEKLILICVLVAVASCLSISKFPHKDDAKWSDFKVRHGQFYKTDAEESARYVIWKTKMAEIEKHNNDPKNTYKMGENHFSAMTHSEFRKKHGNCFKIPADAIVNGTLKHHNDAATFLPPANTDIPDEIDWVKLGAVTGVKNQLQCGSCWAFSSTGALEGAWFRKTGELPSLSEQQLVDCCRTNYGCRGGWPDNSFDYIYQNKGIDSEQAYPYYGYQLGYCYYRTQYNTAQDKGHMDVSPDEASLKIAVATHGPISVAIDATRPGFASYKTGVYVDDTCRNTIYGLDHAVLVVGYGTENGQDYWLVKNSWSTQWGDQGYIKMARNRNNQCGIALKASFPIV